MTSIVDALTQQNIRESSSTGMLVIANARGEYGKYWQWWPPGFVNKPQLMAESHNVFMHWADEISNIYVSEDKNVHRLYSYYWIVQNPSDTPSDLANTIYDMIDEYSYHWNFIILIGHANPSAWEAYYWNHNHETYWTTNELLPNNNNWAPSDHDVLVTIYPSMIRNQLSDNDWYHLPHLVFIIGCDSLDYLTDPSGWAWGFYLSAQDFPSDWLLRGIVGFQGPIYYNWLTGDFKAAEMVKKMIEYMDQGYSSIDAFTHVAEDTGFQYKIYEEPATTNLGGGDGETYAVYIEDYAWQDPSSRDIALKTSIEFMKNYMPTIYELATNNSVQPIVEDLTGKTWYARLVGEPTYRVSWKIPVQSTRYKDVTFMFEVGFTIVVDNGVGKIKSISLMGSVYEEPKLLEKYSINELLAMRKDIGRIMKNDLENLKQYAEIAMNNTPSIISLSMVSHDRTNKIYRLVLKNLNAPIYVNDSNNINPLDLEIITDNKTLFIYDNSIILLSKYLDKLKDLNTNTISHDQAMKEFRDELNSCEECIIRQNPFLIILINTRNHEITPYYYGVYYDETGTVHQVFINAYTGEKKTIILGEAYIPENNNMLDRLSRIPLIIFNAYIRNHTRNTIMGYLSLHGKKKEVMKQILKLSI
jgi:hypothetical protein